MVYNVYSVRIINPDLMYFTSANGVDVSKDNVRKYSFSVKDEAIGNITYRDGLINIPFSGVAGVEPANIPGTENLFVVYLNIEAPLRMGDIIRITHDNEYDDTFYKVKTVNVVNDISSEYNGKLSAVVSVPRAIEYLKEYEVKAVGLDEDDIVSEDILTDEELMNVIYNEIMTNNEYARAIDTLLYTTKQTPSVQSLVSTLSVGEKQDFENASFRQLATTGPSISDLNLKVNSKVIRSGGWVGYEMDISVSPEFILGTKAKLSITLNTKMTVKLTQTSTSFYVDDDTGMKKTGWTKLFDSWEYCTCTVKTSFDTDVSFNITLTMTDGEDTTNGFDPNEDISEQVSNLLDVILEEKTDPNENSTARKLLNEYLKRLDYDMITENLDYITLFEVPLGRITACIYGVDVTVSFDFVVNVGLRCGMTSSFKYHIEKEEITSNGKCYYENYDLDEISIYQIARNELGSNATPEQLSEAYARIKNNIKYVSVKEYKKSSVLSENISFDFTIGGKAGLRAGVKISVRLSGFFLDDFVYIGASVELGAYTELTAYASYHFDYNILYGFSTQSLTGAVKLEVGFYVKFDIEWKFFWYESSYTIIEEQWPLFTISTTPSLYDFNKQSDSATFVGRYIDLKGLATQEEYKSLFDLCNVDVLENSVTTVPIGSSEIDQMRFNLIDWSVTDPRDNSDASKRYYISVSKSGVISVEDKESWRGMRDTDVATIKVYVGLSGKNFLTGDPIGKTLTFTVPLGEIIDLEHTYTIRFLDHLGNVMTYKNGEEMTYELYGNEFPENYPDQVDISSYLNKTYGVGRLGFNWDNMWRDSDGNAVKLKKATEDTDYYINLDTMAKLVRYTYYDPTTAEMKHLDQYLLLGEVAKEPDISALGEAGKLISKWDVSPQLITYVDGIQNYDVEGIVFEESYKHYPVNKEYYLEVFAEYGDKYSEVICYYADEIKDLTDGRRTFVILDANGGRFGTLPNSGAFEYDTDSIVPSNELFTTIEYLSKPSVSYNDIVEHSDYAVPVKFASRFIGWSTTQDGKNIIGADANLNPGVGDTAEIHLYAVYETDPIVKLNLTGFREFTLNNTEYQLKYTTIYLAYKGGNPPELPTLELEDEKMYLDGWKYADGTPFETLPVNPTAEEYIEIAPNIKHYPQIHYSLPSHELFFTEQPGFYYENGNIAYVSVNDINSIRIPDVPIYRLRSFAGWQIYEGEALVNENILSNEELITEAKKLIAAGEPIIYTRAVYTPHSSSFRIAEDCDGEFDVALKDEYIVDVGKTFAESGIPVPSKPGYTFDHWTVDGDNGIYYLSNIIPQGMDHYVLSAVFRSDYADVVFDANGGTFNGQNTNTVRIKIGDPISEVLEPARDGFGFIGWCTLPNGNVIIDTDRFTSSVGLVLYAVWEDRSPRTITFNAGEGEFADGTRVKTLEISYPYNFVSMENSTYTGNEGETWVFAYWETSHGFGADETYRVSDGESFTALYRRTGIKAIFQPNVSKYNEVSGMTDIELGEALYNGAGEYGQVEIHADANGLIQYPTHSFDFAIPDGYELVFMIPNDILSERGISKLNDAGAYIYLDMHGLRYRTLPISLTTDMVIIEEDSTIMIILCVVPADGPDERVRFEQSLHFDDVGYGIIDFDYKNIINYPNGNSVSLDQNGNVIVPEHTIETQPKEGQAEFVLIDAEYLTEAGKAAMVAANARVYGSADGFTTFYEVKESMTLTRDMVKIELQPEFIIAYIPENSAGLCGALLSEILYVEQEPDQVQSDMYFITYTGNGTDTQYNYQLTYDSNGVLVLPTYTIYTWLTDDEKVDYTPEEGKEPIFLIDSQALTDSAVTALKTAGAREYIPNDRTATYYEMKTVFTQNMVKHGAVPNIYLAYVSVD